MAFPWVLYLAVFDAGFVWDDHNLAEGRPRPESLAEFGRLWVSDFWQTDRVTNKSEYYRPLTATTFFLDSLIYGPRPTGYHFTNLLLYSLACGLAFLLYRRLLPNQKLALLVSLAFAALPAHTENVAWIAGRTDIVCAIFMFASLLLYQTWDKTGRIPHLLLSLLLFLLSLFGKEMSITLPAIVFAHQLLFRGVSRAAVVRASPFAAVALVFAGLHALAAPPGISENIYVSPLSYIGNVLRTSSYSVWYAVWPGGFEYLITATREQAERTFRLPSGLRFLVALTPLLAAVAGAAFAVKKKESLTAFALAAGLITILPTSGIIPLGVIFAIRFLFIPSFFFLLALAALLQKLPEGKILGRNVQAHAASFVFVPMITVYAVITLWRLPHWHDDARLMERVLRLKPDSALAHFILGNALASQGLEAEAVSHYKKAISLRPEYAEAMYNLGVLAERRNDPTEAEVWYRRTLGVKADFKPAAFALARLLAGSGRRAEAADLLRGFDGRGNKRQH